MTGPRTKHRRRHTRWYLVATVCAMATIVLGVTELERRSPENPSELRPVEGVPPQADPEVRRCTRQAADPTIGDILDSFPPGGRVTSTQLVACPSAYDGRRVAFAGEVVGTLLRREGGAWAQVNDDDYALRVGPLVGRRDQAGFNTGIAVWLPDGLHERVGGMGHSSQRGDVILVEGAVRRADPEDGGGLTVRADHLEVLAAAVEIDTPFHLLQAVVAGILAAIAVATTLWARAVRRR